MTTTCERILIVEDNEALARIVRYRFESEGFRVSLACNGCEGYEFAQHEQFDLIITDYAMPKMTGADLCRRLRQEARYAQTPIILMTAFSCDLDLARLLNELNLAAIVGKPFSPSELVNTVNTLLGRIPNAIEAVDA